MRSGATTSWWTPWNANSFPFSSRWTNRHSPPGRASILSTVVAYSRGPNHCDTSFGSVNALNTSSRGASKTRVMVSSCFPGSMTYSVFATVCAFAVIGFLLLYGRQVFVESLETLVPKLPVLAHPISRLLQAAAVQPARPPLCLPALPDQPRPLQHFQVFGDAGKAQVERFGQLRDRRLALRKTRQDRSPGGIGEGCKRDAQMVACHTFAIS